jgi:hypothetical protein
MSPARMLLLLFSFAHISIFVCCSLFQIVVCTTPPLHELRPLIRLRLAEDRDVVGFDFAAERLIPRVANNRKARFGRGWYWVAVLLPQSFGRT